MRLSPKLFPVYALSPTAVSMGGYVPVPKHSRASWTRHCAYVTGPSPGGGRQFGSVAAGLETVDSDLDLQVAVIHLDPPPSPPRPFSFST